ncbi:glycerate kinase type-2 family protein [Serpentinimonas raichei]|uniref:glycerate kinase type-2 family protein n=1 Tax=Serpentinimonas raichei TaxID=1458425 RepID=UPI0009E52ACD|nr:glycerate kinase [Serpentinimonas raichei]
MTTTSHTETLLHSAHVATDHLGSAPAPLLRQLFAAAVAAAQPALCLPPHLPRAADIGSGRLWVVGAGKASAAMAQAVEAHWDGDPQALGGLVVTRYGHEAPCSRIEIVAAAHPVPDLAGWRAAERVLASVQGLGADDTVLCLLSGGGSALWPLALPGLGLAEQQALARAMLASGARIGEINSLRRHLSALQGGRLAAACYPARVLTLLISDVPGDDPADIASGPTVPDPSTCADALAIAQRYRLPLPAAALELLHSGRGETLKPGAARLARSELRWLATPQMALEAAASAARAAGFEAHILSDALQGEAREVGQVLAALARQIAQRQQPFAAPCLLLSGGETSVTLRTPSPGQGGRNVECLLACALELNGQPGVYALMADTDGIDGNGPAAGALIGPDTLARAQALGLNAQQMLDQHDAHGCFAALGDALHSGPTRTNVNDFRALLIAPP